MRPACIPFVVVSALLLGCGKKDTAFSPTSVDDKRSTIGAVEARDGDTKMNHATAKTRRTVNQFIRALQTPKPEQNSFSIKMIFDDGKDRAQMWLEQVTYDGSKFHGIGILVRNTKSGQTASVEPGKKVSVETAKILDWMYIESGKLVGGYTIRAERDSLPPAEKAQFEMSQPFEFD